jgi:PEP-CTERM motif
MKSPSHKTAALSLSAIGLSLIASGAWADPPLPNLQNQNFTQYTGSAPKGCFGCVNPKGWTGGSGLIYIDSQTAPNSAAGPVYLTTYGNPTGSVTGNYVEADGNPTYESGFNYTVTGLTPGDTYSLSFYQGASSQTGFGYNPVTGTNTATTNQWIVSLGTQGMQICYNCGGYDPLYGQTSTYYNNDPSASIAATTKMTVPYQGTVGWDYVTVNLTADASTDLLSFLAWGDNGSTVNLPPIAFLSGVDSPPGLGSSTPEASTWVMMGIGFLGLAGAGWRRRVKVPAVAQA